MRGVGIPDNLRNYYMIYFWVRNRKWWWYIDLCKQSSPYTLALISLVSFGPPFKTAIFAVPLVSIFSFFEFNYSYLIHGGMPLINLFLTPLVSNCFHDCKLTCKRWLSCRDYPLCIDGFFSEVSKRAISLASSGEHLLDKYVLTQGHCT